jgi:isopentenyl-diphosphate delta-isomerase
VATETRTVSRKSDHIRINLEEEVNARGVTSGFERYRFLPKALPEIDLAQVSLETDLFGYRLGAPLFISCMTGGTPEAEYINLTLAAAAQKFRVPLGLGSGRVLLEHPEALPSFSVRRVAPDVPIFANLGAVQLNHGIGPEQCRRLIDLIGADALVLHINALQEALQPEGDTEFGNLLPRIASLCAALDVAVIAKEVGWGIAPDVVLRLLDAGVAAVDVAGAGGTSWSEVERHRMDDPIRRQVAAAFAGWGLPTAEAIALARRTAPQALLFASGGIRDGMDMAKAIALGADLVGMAGPFLRAAAAGEQAVIDLLRESLDVIRITMFCLGVADVASLRCTDRLLGWNQQPEVPARDRLSYRTSARGEFIDLTEDIERFVGRTGLRNGVVHVYSAHTTAAIRINENEPLLLDDFRRMLDRLAPLGGYEHDDFSRRPDVPDDEPTNGHSHCQHLLLSSSETVPVHDGRMMLGRWQRVFLIELDSARDREVLLQAVGT